MQSRTFLLLVVFHFICAVLHAQTQLTSNHAFQSGERISYVVFYNAMGIYIKAGTATFTTTNETMQNKDVYHVVAEGATNPKYDWIFKVRDRYESYFNASDLRLVKFQKHISEGKYHKHEEITFNQEANTVVTNRGVFTVPENVQDIISIMYYARNIKYEQYEVGARIPINVFVDGKVYRMYIHYIGMESIKTKYGKFNAIKLKPLLPKKNSIENTGELSEENFFQGSEKMTVWITADLNHIPIRIESPIAVGRVKVDLAHYENLKYTLAALQD